MCTRRTVAMIAARRFNSLDGRRCTFSDRPGAIASHDAPPGGADLFPPWWRPRCSSNEDRSAAVHADSLCSILTSPLGQSESPRLATARLKSRFAFVVQTPHQSGDTTPSRHAKVVGNKFLTIVYLETEKSVGVQTSLGPPLTA